MLGMRQPVSILTLAIASLAIGGCGSTGAAFLAEGAPPAADVESVLLVPLNFDATPPAGLARGAEILEVEIGDYLRGSGCEVRRVYLGEVLRHWSAISTATEFVDEESQTLRDDRVEQARAELARRLLATHPADVIAMPTLLIRKGWYTGFELGWDGVNRRVPVEYEPDSMMLVQSISGKGEGTSLRMTLYSRSGEKFFERYAGLEPIVGYYMSGFGTIQGGRIDPRPRTDLFEDPEIIDEAVALSLSPWITPPTESE